MATYSTNLALTLMATGEQSNTWGDTTNTNLGTLLEQAISGYVTQAITDGSSANTTITIPNGATGVARNMFIEMTGALTFSTTSLIVPANKKLYFIYNNTTGGFAVTVKVSGQTGVSVPNGKKMVLVSNGTDIVNAENYIASLSVGALTSGRVPYAGTAGLLQDSANLTFNGTTLTAAGFSGPISGVITSSSITDSGLTSGRVTYAGTAGLLQDSANLTFNGTTLTANTIGAFTLSGTVAGGGNQLNNVIIGTTTPLAGAFTTLSATGISTLREIVLTNASGDIAGLYVSPSNHNTYLEYATGYNLRMRSAAGTQVLDVSDGAVYVTGTLSATQTISATGGSVSSVVDPAVAINYQRVIRFNDSSNTSWAGYIVSSGTALGVGGNGSIAFDVGGATYATLTSSGLAVTGLVDISAATSGQIKFPATQNASTNANTLDDYEEGTWTPVLGGITSVTYSTQTGAYTKIGNVVNIVLRISVSGGTRSGADLTVANLPFTSASQDYSGGSWGYGYGVVASVTGMPQLRINNSDTTISFLNTAGTVLAGTDLNTSTPTIAFSATYRV